MGFEGAIAFAIALTEPVHGEETPVPARCGLGEDVPLRALSHDDDRVFEWRDIKV